MRGLFGDCFYESIIYHSKILSSRLVRSARWTSIAFLIASCSKAITVHLASELTCGGKACFTLVVKSGFISVGLSFPDTRWTFIHIWKLVMRKTMMLHLKQPFWVELSSHSCNSELLFLAADMYARQIVAGFLKSIFVDIYQFFCSIARLQLKYCCIR